MSIKQKRRFMFFFCREPKLKTLTTGPVFIGTKYVELKKITFYIKNFATRIPYFTSRV